MSRVAVAEVTVFTGDRFLTDHTVVWQNGLIEHVGPSRTIDLTGVTVIRRGGFVTPGLIDAHVHLCLDGTLEMIEGVAVEPLETTLTRCRVNATSQLAHGVTAVRDMGSREAAAVVVSREQSVGRAAGPLIVAAGRGITPTGGHGWMIGVHADGATEVAEATARELRNGATAVKLFPTGGILGSGSHGDEVTMTAAEISAAVRVAHEVGVKVGAHVVGEAGIDVVLEGGVDTIEHAVGLTPTQAVRCLDSDTALVPTLTAVEMMRRHAAELPSDVVKRAEEVAAHHARGVATALEMGVTVLAGTDAGTPFNRHGNLVTELELLARLGAHVEDVLRSATSRSAARLGMAGRGTVSIGSVADLLITDSDPRSSLDALRRPDLVVQAGEISAST